MRRNAFLIDVGKKIQATRLRAGLSQEDLAHRAGLHQVTISLIENGRRSITLTTLERLARSLEVAPRDLIPPLR